MHVHNLFVSLYRKIFLQKEFWCTHNICMFIQKTSKYGQRGEETVQSKVLSAQFEHKIMKTIESKITSDFLSWKIRESMLSPILVKKVVLELNIWILRLLYQEPTQ